MIEKRGNQTWYRLIKSFYKLGKKGRVVHVVASMAACLTLTFTTPALAADIIISDARTASQVITAPGDSMTVTKDGSIAVSNTSAIAGPLGMDLTNSKIINQGSLLGTSDSYDLPAAGIETFNITSASSIENIGTIKVTNTHEISKTCGIFAYSVDNYSSIINSGTIESTNTATDLDLSWGIHSVSISDHSSIINSGTIKISNMGKGKSKSLGVEVENARDSSIENKGIIEISSSRGTGINVHSLINSSIKNLDKISITGVEEGENYGISVGTIDSTSTITNSGTISLRQASMGSHSQILSARDNLIGIGARTGAGQLISNTNIISISADTASLCGIKGSYTGPPVTKVGTPAVKVGTPVTYTGTPVSNTGTITLSAKHAVSVVGMATYYTGTATNEGTISVSADSAGSVAGMVITGDNSVKNGTATNKGTISVSVDPGTVTMGGKTIDTTARGIYNYNGDVINEGTVTATTLAGNLHEDFFSVYTNGNLTNAGTLKGRLGSGTASNSGLIQLSPGISNIKGNFTQDTKGTLGITLGQDGSGSPAFSKLSVTGTTTLADGSGLFVDVTTPSADQPVLIDSTLTGLIQSTGGIMADIDTLLVTDNSALLNFTAALSNGDTSLDMNVIRGRSIFDAVQGGGNSGGEGAAASLDSLTSTTNPQISTFITHLNSLPTMGQVGRQVAQAAPVGATQTPAVNGQLVSTMSSVLQDRQRSLAGLNSGDPVFSDKNLWVKPYAMTMDQDDVDGKNGFSADAYGIGLGMDGELSRKNRLGLAFFYTRADTETNNLNQQSDADLFSLMAYGSHGLFNGETTLFWQAGGGVQSMDTSRYIQALNQTAAADYTARNLFAQTRGVRAFQLAPDLTLSAGAAISYTWLYTPSYEESGAGGMNLSVDSFDAHSLVTALEGELAWSAATDVLVTARASLGYDLINDDAAVLSRFQGAGASFVTQGIDNSPVVFTAGLGVAKHFTDRFSLNASYDLEGRGSDFLMHMLSCKLNWTF